MYVLVVENLVRLENIVRYLFRIQKYTFLEFVFIKNLNLLFLLKIVGNS